MIDYLLGALLVALPFLFDVSDGTATTTAAAVALSVAPMVMAAASDLPTGLVHSLPRALHAVLDYVLALAVIAAPFVLGFSDDDTATPWFVAVGIVQLLQTIGTHFRKDGRHWGDPMAVDTVISVSVTNQA